MKIRWLARSAGGLFVAAAVSLSIGCKDSKATAPAPRIAVVVTPVIERDVPIYREWVGTTVGYVTAQIRARVTGYLVSQNYQEGRLVKTGDLLFRVDARPYQNSLDQAKGKLAQSDSQHAQAQAQVTQSRSQVEQAKAGVAQAEGDLARAVATQKKTQLEVERYTPLAARGSVSQQELDNAVQNNLANLASVDAAKANVDKAKANVSSAQAAVDKAQADVQVAQANIVQAKAGLEEAQLNFGWTKILSPINGIAGIKKVDIGDLVGSATVLTTVAQVDPIYVQFSLSEQEYLRWRATNLERSTRLTEFGLRTVLLALTLAAGLAGCAIGPDYTRPALTPPEQFRGPSATEASSLADLPWWEVFGDPTLRSLVQEALAGNYDLRIAAERVQQARAQSMIARAAFFPTIGYTTNTQRSKQFEAILGISNDPVDSSGNNLFVGALQATWERLATDRYLYGLASYFEVLEPQQHLFPAQNTQAGIRLNRLLAYVNLYKALGGGWDVKDPETPPPASASLGQPRAACAGTRC